ncbi:hypothetical protein [Microtetraspora fusca]|uniref:Uncharacterized protein n=1 Tax=Microtetraspora fusca TaxID=1997 RepID=A0ABW6UXI6_MICFU|nr:hypothetical protein [Microtetraspora fusca]
MRRILIAAAIAALTTTTAAACGQGAGEPAFKGALTTAGTAPEAVVATSPTAPPVYVKNLYGAEQGGRDDSRPANLVLSEFSSMNGITWTSWEPDRAVGTGGLSGNWCLPGCLENRYEATVTLSGVTTVKGTRYFTRFTVDGDFPKPADPADALAGSLPTP